MSDETEHVAVDAEDRDVAALAAIAMNTGWASAGELEITRRISPVAPSR
jgi:hypothetical protein